MQKYILRNNFIIILTTNKQWFYISILLSDWNDIDYYKLMT